MSYKNIPLYKTSRRRPPVQDLINCVEETIKNLRHSGAMYICYAIPEGNVGNYLRGYVDSALGGYTTLHGWRRANRLDRESKATRKARFAWLHWMLKNLKEELADIHDGKYAKHDNQFAVAA